MPSIPEEPVLLLTREPNSAATVTLNRPNRRNALDAELVEELLETFTTLARSDVRVVFLRGAGEVFCAGADLSWMRAALNLDEAANHADALALARMLKALRDLPALTVALVHGSAFGGGAGLVAACDLAIATADTRFSFSEVKLGLIPATIAPHVVRAIGPRHAKRFFATGEVFRAATAERIGLISDVAGNERALASAAAALAADVAACAPGAVRDAKRLVEDMVAAGFDDDVLHDTARRIAAARVGAEGQEGVRAYLEKRRPTWWS